MARENGYTFRIAEAVEEVNTRQRFFMADKIEKALAGSLAGKSIAVLGLTFKPNTNDMREAPSLTILPELHRKGASIKAYDPAGMGEAARLLPFVKLCRDAYDCMAGADLLVLMTEWHQFRNLDWERVKELMPVPRVVDLRNVYEPEKVRGSGIGYCSVGRP
jgi:UDPglucose 6-dehydrogenase